MQPERKYRPLLPAEPARSTETVSSSGSSSAGPPPSQLQHSSNRGAGTRSACDTCRARKTACDGMRPMCTACRRQGKAECVYTPRSSGALISEVRRSLEKFTTENEDLRRQLGENGRLLAMLLTSPEDEALLLLKQLRSEKNASALLAKLHDPSRKDTNQLPELNRADRAVPVPTQSSLEFELMVRHPVAYPTLVPMEAAHVDVELLLWPETALESSLTAKGKVGISPPTTPSLRSGDGTTAFKAAGHRLAHGGKTPQPVAPLVPLRGQAPAYCDERLARIEISNWTTVATTNEFAATAISLYLETDHPLLGLFDADLFLENLVTGELHFCSPLLVNALLCWACGYSYFDPVAATQSKLFYEVAKVLWYENSVHTLTAVAAAMLVSTAASCYGETDEAKSFLRAGIEMGKDLGLFGVSEPGSAKRWLDHHHDWVRFASHTAWGVYSSATYRSLHDHAGQIQAPPHLPIPGDGRTNLAITSDPTLVPGRTSIQDQFHPLPLYMGSTFPALCGLWAIANRIILAYYDHDDHIAPTTRATLEEAEEWYSQLLDWAKKLPLNLVRGDKISHHATVAHIYYHAIICDLFRPFTQGSDRNTLLKGLESEFATPAAIFAASINQLLRLTLVYRARFPCASYTFLWHTALLYVANAMLSPEVTTTKPGASRVWFNMCLNDYCNLFTSFPIVEGIVQGLLSMALRNRVVKAHEARDITIKLRQQATQLAGNTIAKGPLIVDLNLAMVNPVVSDVENLVDQFNTLAMWEEFTTENEVGEEMMRN